MCHIEALDGNHRLSGFQRNSARSDGSGKQTRDTVHRELVADAARFTHHADSPKSCGGPQALCPLPPCTVPESLSGSRLGGKPLQMLRKSSWPANIQVGHIVWDVGWDLLSTHTIPYRHDRRGMSRRPGQRAEDLQVGSWYAAPVALSPTQVLLNAQLLSLSGMTWSSTSEPINAGGVYLLCVKEQILQWTYARPGVSTFATSALMFQPFGRFSEL